MSTTRARITDSTPDPIDLVDEFLPPLAMVPDVSQAAWAEFAAVVASHDAAEAALLDYMEANPRRQSHGRNSTLHNERTRLHDEGHPLATAAVNLENARRMARQDFRMQMLDHRDAWAAHLDELTRRDLGTAGDVVREALERIRAAALVPATHAKWHAAFDSMTEGFAVADWWSTASKPARIPVGARLLSLDTDLLAPLEALAIQLTPEPTTNGEV